MFQVTETEHLTLSGTLDFLTHLSGDIFPVLTELVSTPKLMFVM